MKRAIIALLNSLRLYTRGQISNVLGRPIDELMLRVPGGNAAGMGSVRGKSSEDERLRFLRLVVALVTRQHARSAEEALSFDELVTALVTHQHAHCAGDALKLARVVSGLVTRPSTQLDAAEKDVLNLLLTVHALAIKDMGLVAGLGTLPVEVIKETLANFLIELRKEQTFQQAQGRSRIRELYLCELFKDIEEVSIPIGAINEETGHVNPTDLLFVSAMARYRQAQQVFEIGTYLGRTTYHLTYASENAIVTTVNLAPEVDPRHAPYLQTYFRGRAHAAQIRQVWADSTRLETTPYRQQMDFVFVDGDHSYEAVKADTARAFEVLAPGGMIVWHDYASKSPGVYRFFEEFTQQRAVFRIRKTCLLVYLDGVDALTFQPQPMRATLEQKIAKNMAKKKRAA